VVYRTAKVQIDVKTSIFEPAAISTSQTTILSSTTLEMSSATVSPTAQARSDTSLGVALGAGLGILKIALLMIRIALVVWRLRKTKAGRVAKK